MTLFEIDARGKSSGFHRYIRKIQRSQVNFSLSYTLLNSLRKHSLSHRSSSPRCHTQDLKPRFPGLPKSSLVLNHHIVRYHKNIQECYKHHHILYFPVVPYYILGCNHNPPYHNHIQQHFNHSHICHQQGMHGHKFQGNQLGNLKSRSYTPWWNTQSRMSYFEVFLHRRLSSRRYMHCCRNCILLCFIFRLIFRC